MRRPWRRFVLRLAGFLKIPVRQLLATHTAEEIAEWQAFDLIEPIGGDAEDLRFGKLTQVVHNAFFKEPVKLDACLLAYRPPPEPQDLTAKALAAFGISPNGNDRKP